MLDLGLRDLLLFGLAVIQAVGVKAAFRLADALTGIREHLATLNGKVTTCDALRNEHLKEAGRRDQQVENRLQYLERKDK